MNDKNRLKGTTTVGLTCKDGVVFATERRATMGNLIAHKVADKIFKIDDQLEPPLPVLFLTPKL